MGDIFAFQVISGEKIGYAGRGLRINKIENVRKAIHFLQEKKVKSISQHRYVQSSALCIIYIHV